jgi:hypothetical protein
VLFVLSTVKLAVRKLPHMTWFGHCIVNVATALRALPSAGQLMLISDLRDFLDAREAVQIPAIRMDGAASEAGRN